MQLVPDSHPQPPSWCSCSRRSDCVFTDMLATQMSAKFTCHMNYCGREEKATREAELLPQGRCWAWVSTDQGRILTGEEMRVSLMPRRFWKNGSWDAQVQPGAHKSILSQMFTARELISGKYPSLYFYFGPCEVLWISMQNAELI